MDIVYRLEPLVGFYEVVKYLDPRLLQILFYKDESIVVSSDSHGHDISGNLIYHIIQKNEKSVYLLLSQTRELDGDLLYYLTFIEKESSQYYSVFAGKNMESAVSRYLEEVTGGGVSPSDPL